MSFHKIYIGGFHGIPSSINLPRARVGAPIEATDVEKLAREIDRNKIQSIKGSSIRRNSSGTTVSPLRKFAASHPWRTYTDGTMITVEIGHAYGSWAKSSGTADAELYSGGRDENSYRIPNGYDIYCDIAGAVVNDGEPWSVSFTPPSDCHDWAVVLRLSQRTQNKKDDDGKEIPNSNGSMSNNGSGAVPDAGPDETAPEDPDNTDLKWKPNDDYVAMVSLVYYSSGSTGLTNVVPIAVLEAIRDPDGKPKTADETTDEECIGKKPFLNWNVTQVASSDIALERHNEIRRHPFEVYFTDESSVTIEQGMVFCYPQSFVDTMGMSHPDCNYPNAVRLGQTIKDTMSAARPQPAEGEDPLPPLVLSGNDAYLLNSNGQQFSVVDGSIVYLRFGRGTYLQPNAGGDTNQTTASTGGESDYQGWGCTLEIGTELPATKNTMSNKGYSTNYAPACFDDYPYCGVEKVLTGASGGLADPIRWGEIDGVGMLINTETLHYQKKHVFLYSQGDMIYPIAKISGTNVIQILRSDFFFSPPLDITFWMGALVPYTVLQPTSGLEPNEGGGGGGGIPDVPL